ncbi:MAG: hypothetical protein P8Q40_04035 [Candidatus Poseidonia sp.]|uniref:COG1470 family protein n=1 Tax=Poseidonia sp. TaxID=2666344 RepID=UPI0030BFB4CC|nr:hypothetical protein [Poseidonia sp.]MDG1552603.1 hypothetical protein [Poseidonia sp.]
MSEGDELNLVESSAEDIASREAGILEASQTLERIARKAARRNNASLTESELDLGEAKVYLGMHNLSRAKKNIKHAESILESLEEDVLHLRRSIAMLHRLLVHKRISLDEAEHILFKLRESTAAAEVGDIRAATEEVEYLLEDLIGGNSSTLNPFLFRHFWMGVDTRWPAGGDSGVLLVRIINDGPIPMPMLRLKPPVPEGWTAFPPNVDLPIIAPGGNIPLRFEIKPDYRMTSEDVPLTRKLSVATSYEMRSGEITITMRAQNRSMEPLSEILLSPWLPAGFTAEELPFVRQLAPDEVAIIRMPLRINLGQGGSS